MPVPVPRETAAYHLSASGAIVPLHLAHTDLFSVLPRDLNEAYDGDEVYVVQLGVTVFLVLHTDNRSEAVEHAGAQLPLNWAIRHFWPSSTYAGDALVVQTEDNDGFPCSAIDARSFDLRGAFDGARARGGAAVEGFMGGPGALKARRSHVTVNS